MISSETNGNEFPYLMYEKVFCASTAHVWISVLGVITFGETRVSRLYGSRTHTVEVPDERGALGNGSD